jgi:oxysterol-binding protein 1
MGSEGSETSKSGAPAHTPPPYVASPSGCHADPLCNAETRLLTRCRRHKRTKSAVTRALQRISSRGDVPTLSSTQVADKDKDADMASSPSPTDGKRTSNGDSLQPNRASIQSHRPHLSTTMSNTAVPHATAPSPSHDDDEPYAASSATQGATIEQSVRLFKIFEALRSGDTAAIAKACKPDGEGKLEGTSILHLAIQCAELPVIEYVLSQQTADINARDRDGNTPLHVAAMLGRAPVVKLLLDQAEVNDAIVNLRGQTPLDVARNPDIFQQLQLARSVFMDSKIREIQRLVTAGDYEGLEHVLSDSRVKTILDVNGPELVTDPATTEHGGTLLHEAARKRDLKLAQILLLNGADPFRRDRKGKLAQDVTKDERTRAILKRSPAAQAAQRSIQEKTILGEGAQAGVAAAADAGPGGKESREIKGYLRKWTNYTSGYKLRWFVLEDGVLSYYKHQDDAGSACRGAINMRIAQLQMDPKDKLLFEIHGKSSVKYLLKANHQVEAKRWFWALNNAIQWAKDEAREEQKRQQQETLALREARNEQLERQKTREAEVAASSRHSLVPSTALDAASNGFSTPQVGSSIGDQFSGYERSMQDGESAKVSRTNTATIEGDVDDDEEYGDDASSHEIRPASKDAFSITAQSAKLQLDLLEQVSAALQSEKRNSPDMALSHPTVVQALASYDTAVGNLKGLLLDLLRISRDHEAYWQYQLEREKNVRRLWEDSMARVAKEQEELENRIGESEVKRKRTKKALREALEGHLPEGKETIASPTSYEDTSKPKIELPEDVHRNRRMTISELTNNEVSDGESEDEEDEFFDALDAGEVEIIETMPPTSPVPPAVKKEEEVPEEGLDGVGSKVIVSVVEEERKKREMEISKSYKGYEDGLRKRLKLDADNRPKVSLWVRWTCVS